MHDMRIFRYSGLQSLLDDDHFPDETFLIGDKAYVNQNRLIAPFKDNGHLSVEDKHFNRRLSSARILIEHANGLLKNRWRILRDKCPMTRTDLLPFYVDACCIFHNICLKENDEFPLEIEIPEPHANNLEPIGPSEQEITAGNNKRNILKYTMQ